MFVQYKSSSYTQRHEQEVELRVISALGADLPNIFDTLFSVIKIFASKIG